MVGKLSSELNNEPSLNKPNNVLNEQNNIPPQKSEQEIQQKSLLDSRKQELQQQIDNYNVKINKLAHHPQSTQERADLIHQRNIPLTELRYINKYYDQTGVNYNAGDVLKYAGQKAQEYENQDHKTIPQPTYEEGIYTKEGNFYPTTNPNFIPPNSNKEDVTFVNKKGNLSNPNYNNVQTNVPVNNLQGEKPIYDENGKLIGVDSEYFKQSMPIDKYNSEIERIKKVYPKEEYYNPNTTQLFEQQQFIGKDNLISTTPVKVYVNPQTNKPIENINEYMAQNKIPINKESNIKNADELKKFLIEPKTYDTQNIPNVFYTRMESGEAVPITDMDLITASTGLLGVSKIGIIKTAQIVLSKPITDASTSLIDTLVKRQDTGFSPIGIIPQLERASLFILSAKYTGISYGTELVKGLATSPIETSKGLIEYTSKNPYEAGTIFLSPFVPSPKFEISKLTFEDVNLEKTPTSNLIFGNVEGNIPIEFESNLGIKVTKIPPAIPLPIGAGTIKTVGKSPEGLPEGIRKDLAEIGTKNGGYVGGSTAIQAKYGIESFREGSDIEIYTKNKENIPVITSEIENLLKQKGINYNLEKQPEINNLPSLHNVFETPEGKNIVEVLYRGGEAGKDQIVKIKGINYRNPEEVIADKYQIKQVYEEGEKMPNEKINKTLNDIELIESAEKDFNKPNTIYRGIYIKIAEGKVKPLIGYGEKGVILGMPKAEDLPNISKVSLTEDGLPMLSRGNIESYPKSAFQTTILTNKEILSSIFEDSATKESDINAILLQKEFRETFRNQKSAFINKFPEKTKILNKEETEFVLEFAKSNPKSFERFYGSFTDITQMPKDIQREPNDIEIKFESEAQAKEFGTTFEEQAQAKGFNLKLIEDEGLGIYKGQEKAIELKYKGDPNELIGGTGYRYGFKEERPNIKIESIESQTQYEQFIRKSATSTTWFKEIQESGSEVNIAEVPLHRAKDIPDVYREMISLSKSYKLLNKVKDLSNNKGNRGLKIAEEYRSLFKEVPKGISPERIILREEVIELFKDLPDNEMLDITNELKSKRPQKKSNIISKIKIMSKVSEYSNLNSQLKSIMKMDSSFSKNSGSKSRSISYDIYPLDSSYNSASKSVDKYLSPSASPSVSKSMSAYLSPSPSPSPSKSVSPYLSPSPTKFKEEQFIYLEEEGNKKKKKRAKERVDEILTYAQDFTSKAVDLPNIKVRVKDLDKFVKMPRNALDIRRGVTLIK